LSNCEESSKELEHEEKHVIRNEKEFEKNKSLSYPAGNVDQQ
jgi:hypothetical protein